MNFFLKAAVRLWREWRAHQKQLVLQRIDRKMLKRAKSAADHLHAQTGKKYYVILGRRGYEVINSYQINKMKKMGILKKGTTFIDLKEISTYIAG